MVEVTIRGNMHEIEPVLSNLNYLLPYATKKSDKNREGDREIVYHLHGGNKEKELIIKTTGGKEIRIPFLQLVHADFASGQVFAGTVYDMFATDT
ncbi:hypothetical protein [Shimazuella alba]|uniref:Uncharacterized protein n=1 Tax=Shimazuella alba TaxID=2690964 RepID=A0A6I4VV79_9BACL|nr:hypothetical protein [Shimazuella alba]MXQ53740.1 hypothetical protein [Shimazuella alba]